MFEAIFKSKFDKTLENNYDNFSFERGMFYLNSILYEEIKMNPLIDYSEKDKMLKVIRANKDHYNFVNIVKSLHSRDNASLRAVIFSYPSIASSIVSIIQECETNATMMYYTSVNGNHLEEMNKSFESAKSRLNELYFSHPREVMTIFNIFSLNDNNMRKVYKNFMDTKDFSMLFSLIGQPEDKQEMFRERINTFISFCNKLQDVY